MGPSSFSLVLFVIGQQVYGLFEDKGPPPPKASTLEGKEYFGDLERLEKKEEGCADDEEIEKILVEKKR